ncbi:hypothetical protein E2562_033299 [Oryza meyeriana var. granulata]|uniref:F-box domain-containing protein n=1 Tax=Oryza meyeriana var. granulata TaxID=110450 RepID=A0A6G1F136_9ORYZ|nr:hypothetical protein E2562_033299 [Oryza meyeriana var. granulata]
MPPVRLARPHQAATPYTWPRHRRGPSYSTRGDDDAHLPTALPDDILLFEILTRVFSDADDVALFASTCPRWSSFVATHGATISRMLPPPCGHQNIVELKVVTDIIFILALAMDADVQVEVAAPRGTESRVRRIGRRGGQIGGGGGDATEESGYETPVWV